jgi:hypothetical protein
MQPRSVFLAFLAPFVLSSCAVVASPVGNAAIYTSVRGPITTGVAANASKEGRACASNILGIVAVGDASITAAKRNGGIVAVASVDHDSLNVLAVYSRYCTIVAGE